MTAGAATLVACALIISDAAIAQQVARSSLRAAAVAEQRVRAPAAQQPRRVLPRALAVRTGAAIAALSIPRVQLTAVVLHGSDPQTLRRGPGHLENTAFPGERGNVVIAGHRDSFFWPLRNIRLGDDIFLDSAQGQFHYQVTSLRVVKPHDVSVLSPTGDAVLTLITCYPFWGIGNAPDRFIVRAAAVADAAAPAPPLASLARLHPHADAALAGRPPAGDAVVARGEPDRRDSRLVGPQDDDTLVRRSVERYRAAYNAPLVGHDGGSLTFRGCEVAVNEDHATAECEAAVNGGGAAPARRTFSLERVRGEWAIKSIVLR